MRSSTNSFGILLSKHPFRCNSNAADPLRWAGSQDADPAANRHSKGDRLWLTANC